MAAVARRAARRSASWVECSPRRASPSMDGAMAGPLDRVNRHHAAAVLILAGLVCASCVTIARRAEVGRGAFVRWMDATEGVAKGEMIYRRLRDDTGMDEGFPNPPLTERTPNSRKYYR